MKHRNDAGERRKGDGMETGWLIFGICIVVVLGAALPLIRGRGAQTPPPPPKETLPDWRRER